MAWIRLLEQPQVEVIVDDERHLMMLEVNSAGAVPKYVTVHIHQASQVDELIHALEQAKGYFTA